MKTQKATRLVFVAMLVSLSATAVDARPGDLDRMFGFGGAVIRPDSPSSDAQISAIAIQPDGQVITASGGFGPTVARYLTDGRLDPDFGDHGQIVISDEYSPTADVVVQPDGRVLVSAGSTIYRLTPSGARDTTFGSDGRAEPPRLPELPFAVASFESGAIALQSDGKILLAGTLPWITFGGNSLYKVDSDFAVMRFDDNGNVDGTFGAGGVATIDFGTRWGTAQDVAIQPDGRILLGGSSCQWTGVSGGHHTFFTDCADDYRGVVSRLLPDGRVDYRFGERGIASIASTIDVPSVKIQILKNRQVLTLCGASDGSFVTRLATSGKIELSFGLGGVARAPAMAARDFAIDSRGRIVIVGSLAFNRTLPGPTSDWFTIVRLLRDGQVDVGFGFGGIVATVSEGRAAAVALQGDGKIVVAGTYLEGQDAIVRLDD